MNNPTKFENRLIHEKSPYLLQHAHNPVDWYPWNPEAFEKAQKEDKPIFLSIGYSTCHWCHVMEHESFEDPTIAKIINDYFVPIKVDREERPDIDHAYMTAVTAITGQGGWPLTVFLTPQKNPFFGGTYFSPYAKWGQPGLIDLLQSIHQAWSQQRQDVVQSSVGLLDFIKHRINVKISATELDEEILEKCFRELSQTFDTRNGGFGSAPKFPMSHSLSFLLRYARRIQESSAQSIVEQSLVKMAQGGVNDQLGGGFHRYSTDQAWQIPHFEKMLYDQAILARTYLEAYQMTKNPFFAKIAREIFEYVLRDLKDPDGAFYCAEDADSLDPEAKDGHKSEGAFYLWRAEEIEKILQGKDLEIFKFHFGIKPNGNAHEDPQGEFTGKNVLFVEHSIEETAKIYETVALLVEESLARSTQKLLAVRNKRPRPHLDDKILVDWNGLMIGALSLGARVLNEPKYAEAAEAATRFIQKHLFDSNNRLLHRFRDGEAKFSGTLTDYAFFVCGLIDLYEATFKSEYLKLAIELNSLMFKLFWDDQGGGYYLTAIDAEEILFRQKEVYDGALPSGNSIAALNLIRLYHLTGNQEHEQRLQKLFAAFAGNILERPSAYTQMLIAVDFARGPASEIVVTDGAGQNSGEMLNKINEYFLPNTVILLYPKDPQEAEKIIKLAPFMKNQNALKGKSTVYVCRNHTCELPTTDISQLEKLLTK